jgi:hypothetical protein
VSLKGCSVTILVRDKAARSSKDPVVGEDLIEIASNFGVLIDRWMDEMKANAGSLNTQTTFLLLSVGRF